jgi:deoxyribose-phosphate aldolase
MTKLYQKLIKACPSDAEIRKALKKVNESIKEVPDKRRLMGILNLIDLTSLNTTDNKSSILKFTGKVNSFSGRFTNIPNVAAICVFPNFVPVVKEKLMARNVKIAAVAGGFPTSQTFRSIKVAECKMAVDAGAEEIDIVLPVGEFLSGNYSEIITELDLLKAACGTSLLKVILETGALKTPENIWKASWLAMQAGADFIKTSTGKLEPAATPEAAWIMCTAIKEYFDKTGKRIGFKAAGGITEPNDALRYVAIVKDILGEEWLNKSLFRIGASRLANNVLSTIKNKPMQYF